MHASVTIQRDSGESRKKKSVSMDFLVPENIPAKRRAYGTVAPQKKTVDLDSIFQHIESSQNQFVELLAEGVAIAGVSAEPKRRQEVIRMVEYMETLCKKRKECVSTRARTVQTINDGKDTIPLPPLLAQFGTPKKTVDSRSSMYNQHIYPTDGNRAL